MISLAQALVGAVAACALSFGLGYLRGDAVGEARGRAAVEAEWNKDRVAQHEALQAALAKKEADENALTAQLQEKADAYTKELARLDGALDGARRELVRLRAALATSAIGHRERSQAAAAGPPSNDPGAVVGELLGACAGELVEMGREAGTLAAQVAGLQEYARIAQRACGSN